MAVHGIGKVRVVCLLHALAHNMMQAHGMRAATACGEPSGRAGHARADAWLEALPRRLVLQPACWLRYRNTWTGNLSSRACKVGLDYVPESGDDGGGAGMTKGL